MTTVVSRAFQILSDPDKKKKFDTFGGDPESRFGAGGGAQGPSSPFSSFTRANGTPGRGAMFEEDISPEELFRQFFGGGMGGGGGGFGGPFGTFSAPPPKSHLLSHNIRLSLHAHLDDLNPRLPTRTSSSPSLTLHLPTRRRRRRPLRHRPGVRVQPQRANVRGPRHPGPPIRRRPATATTAQPRRWRQRRAAEPATDARLAAPAAAPLPAPAAVLALLRPLVLRRLVGRAESRLRLDPALHALAHVREPEDRLLCEPGRGGRLHGEPLALAG